jgi:hypothetical protein
MEIDERVIHQKLDKIVEHMGSIDITLARQADSLVEHIRRTELLEHRIDPIEKNWLMHLGAIKLVGGVTGIIGFIAAVSEILSYLNH